MTEKIYGGEIVRREDGERWEKTLQVLAQELSDEEFQSWFNGLKLLGIKSNTSRIFVSTNYRKDWMARQYTDFLAGIMSKIWGKRLKVAFITQEDLQHHDREQPKYKSVGKPSPRPSRSFEESGLNPFYTFENFVVGENTRMTHAAALAVAESPSHFYNPLFIHGGVGLGKTHLLQAIGHKVQELHPHMRVLYLPAETFMNEFIEAIKKSDRLEFNEKYRKVDVLLIDDVHFLAGKEGTQDEFFHTFNSLHNEHKQIVISSDRPPKDIPTLSDRLRSRFGWGLITDIKPPNVETRAAILRRKCELNHIPLSDEIIMFVADCIQCNVRELEGALVRLVAHIRTTKEPMTIKTAAQLLADIVPAEARHLSIEGIQRRVAEYFHVKTSDLLGKNRSKSIAFPRQIAMYLCKSLTDHSLSEIGTYFGNKDHTTVLYSYRKIKDGLKQQEELRQTVDRVSSFVKEVVNR